MRLQQMSNVTTNFAANEQLKAFFKKKNENCISLQTLKHLQEVELLALGPHKLHFQHLPNCLICEDYLK